MAAALLVSLITLLAAGLHNVADGFADVKLGSSPWIHWGGALAVELGVVAIALTVAVRARSGDQNLRLYTGVLLFVAASVFANYDASLESLAGGTITWAVIRELDPWTLAKAALLGGAIPLMVLLVIESLRELAAEGRPSSVPYQQGASPRPDSEDSGRSQTEDMPRGHSVSRDVSGAVSPNGREGGSTRSVSHGSGEEKGTRDTLRQLMLQEPSVSATELARRLNIGRATVYRWRDDLGAERVDGRWVLE